MNDLDKDSTPNNSKQLVNCYDSYIARRMKTIRN